MWDPWWVTFHLSCGFFGHRTVMRRSSIRLVSVDVWPVDLPVHLFPGGQRRLDTGTSSMAKHFCCHGNWHFHFCLFHEWLSSSTPPPSSSSPSTKNRGAHIVSHSGQGQIVSGQMPRCLANIDIGALSPVPMLKNQNVVKIQKTWKKKNVTQIFQCCPANATDGWAWPSQCRSWRGWWWW